MSTNEQTETQISDRRRHDRRTSHGTVRLTVDTKEVEGALENVSRSGLLFFSDGDLRVTVQIQENEKTNVRTGRLVRAQRMRGESIGWAVELDP
jgi:PilZ domain